MNMEERILLLKLYTYATHLTLVLITIRTKSPITQNLLFFLDMDKP